MFGALVCRRACHKAASVNDHRIIESRLRMQIIVRDNNIDQALRVLKKRLQLAAFDRLAKCLYGPLAIAQAVE